MDKGQNFACPHPPQFFNSHQNPGLRGLCFFRKNRLRNHLSRQSPQEPQGE